MISIKIDGIGKKFGSEWIFRDIHTDIAASDKIVLLGSNGSGKSTLLQIISGFVTASKGKISYVDNGRTIEESGLKDYISFASPYLQLVEEFTLSEMISHATMFKPFKNKLQEKEVVEILELSHAKNKFIRQFSSGMKQRLKLGLAILADTSLLLLDEPVSNLDKESIKWYQNLLQQNSSSRTIIIASNKIEEEYFICDKQLNVMDFKPKK